ncbi:MAG: hypothetical protein P9L92_13245 [Candidatus Electryonea clarkiae]|nr:hypothetical protein [Candidatus Electryonea clarkiae]MDP8285327.1 hypothetical protein [Candidatus Electryonea clarkiae]
MKLITRLDIDGLLCAAMIYKKQLISSIRFATPKQIEERFIDIEQNDCIAHLPFHPDAGLWFHHHDYELLDDELMRRVKGKWGQAKSTAQLVYDYYDSPDFEQHKPILDEVNRIYSAEITEEDILDPSGWMLLYCSLDPHLPQDIDLGEKIIKYICDGKTADQILDIPVIAEKAIRYYKSNKEFEAELVDHTEMHGKVIVSDFRGHDKPPRGNRFLAFQKYPKGNVFLRIDNIGKKHQVLVSVSKSVFDHSCETHLGHLMSLFAGGGAEGAGSCPLKRNNADESIERIIDFL